jgi:chemotaxis protein MotB
MSFFLILLSVSTIDQTKLDATVEGLKEGSTSQKGKFVSPFEVLKENLEKVQIEYNLQNDMTVVRQPKGVTVELSSASLYEIGSAEIQEHAMATLHAVSKTIKDFDFKKFQVEVEGHTDNVAIHTPQYPSNWELSVHRATNIIKLLTDDGIDASKMKAAGYADTRPKVPNTDASGNPIKENQAANRRIVIHVIRDDG